MAPLPSRSIRFSLIAMLLAPITALLLMGVLAWAIGAFAGKNFVGDDLNPGEAFIVLGAFCFPLAAFVFARTELHRAQALASRSWPVAQGVVTKCEPTSRLTGHGMTYALDFACIYSVARESYATDQIQFGTGRAGSRDLIDEFARKYPVNSKVTVRYDPDDVSSAVLESSDEMASDNRSLVWMLVIPPPLAALVVLFRSAA